MLTLALSLALGIGVVLGLLGGGGSILMVPVLLYVLDMEPKAALASSQLILAATSAVAVVVHARASRVVLSVGALFGMTGMVGAYFGGWVARFVPARLLLLGVTGLILISAVAMLRRGSTVTKEERSPALSRGAAVGSLTGFLAGLLGVGGGFLIVPALTQFGGLPMKEAVGTSLLVITLQASMGALGYLRHATVNWEHVSILALAMAIGSIGGGLLSEHIPAAALRRLFAILVLLVAVWMLVRTAF